MQFDKILTTIQSHDKQMVTNYTEHYIYLKVEAYKKRKKHSNYLEWGKNIQIFL